MAKRTPLYIAMAMVGMAGVMAACSADQAVLGLAAPGSARFDASEDGGGAFRFEGIASSTACTNGGNPASLLVLPAGFDQTLLASEPSFADAIDMNTVNETGPQAGRFLYRVTETGNNGSLSVTDLETGITKTVAQRIDWERLDGIVWTPWNTLLFSEETNAAGFRDPRYPASVAGLVYEVFFRDGDLTTADSVVARPSVGSKSHEGMRFDAKGDLYTISERAPGYIYRFVPDRAGDLSSGQSYALKITQADGDRTGEAEWVPLDRAAVEIDANTAGDVVGATGYARPEDVEIGTSTGRNKGGPSSLFVAITGEDRVIEVDLREPKGKDEKLTAFVSDYVKAGLNAPVDFESPDNLALDRAGNLYITEDPGGNFAGGKRLGDDVWYASPNRGPQHGAAGSVLRFATLNDCDAEPTGVYYDLKKEILYVNIQHRGGDRQDKALAVGRAGSVK